MARYNVRYKYKRQLERTDGEVVLWRGLRHGYWQVFLPGLEEAWVRSEGRGRWGRSDVLEVVVRGSLCFASLPYHIHNTMGTVNTVD